MNNKKKYAVVLGAVVFAAIAAVCIWYFIGNGGRDSKDRVYVEKVSTIMNTVTGAQNRYSGVVQPQKTVDVNADAERTVKDIMVKVGDTVEEGTPLFNYDTDELSMEMEQAQLEIDNQDIEISNYRNQISELEKEKKEASEDEKFEYTTQIQTIETQIRQAEFEKQSKQLEINKLQQKIDNSQVVSTTAGTVKSINDGQSADGLEGSSAFMTILSTGDFRVKGMVNEQNVWQLSEGTNVIIRSRVDEEITWSGVIESIDAGEPSSVAAEDMGEMSEESAGISSKYPFYVAMEDTQNLMLGQHVLIELDEGQAEPKEGVWLYGSYIVFDEDGEVDEEEAEEDLIEATEPSETYEFFGMEMKEEEASTEFFDYFDTIEDTEISEGANYSGRAFVWADDGNGRLEKRFVELGEYDELLDEYEILSGLTEDDLIAFPMEGLYEGIRTVTSMDEVDYSSSLYDGMDTEEDWDDTEVDYMDDMMFDGLEDGDEESYDVYDADDFEEDEYEEIVEEDLYMEEDMPDVEGFE